MFGFVFKFKDDIGTQFADQFATESRERFFEDRARSFIEVENVYTDKDGEIHFFEKPDHRIWWIEMVQTTFKKGKSYDVPLPKDEAVDEHPSTN